MSSKIKLNHYVEAFLTCNEGVFSYDEIGRVFGTTGHAIGRCMVAIGKRNLPITRRVVYKKEKQKMMK